MASNKQLDRFLTAYQVAELLGLHHTTVRNGEAGTDAIPRIKLGSRVVWSELAVREWMARKAREAEERLREEKRESCEARRRVLNRLEKGRIRQSYLSLVKSGKYSSDKATNQ